MSSDATMESNADTDTAGEDMELILEDEIEDVQLIELSDDAKVVKEDDEDDDIEIVEQEERKTLWTEEMARMATALKEEADKFFDPDSPTNVANLLPEMRKDMSRYAAALFEWICCLPSVDLLSELYMGDIDLPFPVKPENKRALVRREFGARLADVWRQTKSATKMANHFKLLEPVALLSLLDYAFTNSSHDLDVYPLLKMHEISKEDYHTVVSFIFKNCDGRMWKTPDVMLYEALMPPLTCSIALYLMNTECMRGTQVAIPWEELDTDIHNVAASLCEEQEQALLEAFRQMEMECPVKKKVDETQAQLREAEKAVDDMSKEVVHLRNSIVLKKIEFVALQKKADGFVKDRRREISEIKPDNFQQHGEALAKADGEITITLSRKPLQFNKAILEPVDVRINVDPEKTVTVLARRNEDASEPFQEAQLIKWEEDGTKAVVRFATGDELKIPQSSIALSREKGAKQMPIVSEGVRVAAWSHHPLRPKERGAYYSGTIITKYNLKEEDYAVVFDDFFENYVNIHKVRLLMKQPFNNANAFDRPIVYNLLTPNPSVPESATEERRVFLLLFFSLYPEWGCVKMNEKVGNNMATVHRNGQGWVAQALKVDRQMVWLRFNPKQTGTEDDNDPELNCVSMPCKIAGHEHLDEKMYRGNPRLKQMNVQLHFDDAMKLYRSLSDAQKNDPRMHLFFMSEYKERIKQITQRQNRRHQVSNGMAFEPALMDPNQQHLPRGPMAQTARKCGTALQMEAAVPLERRVKKKVNEVPISHRAVESIIFGIAKTPKDKEEHPELRTVDFYHEKCTPECLKGQDADPENARFTKENISPYFIPIMCGWRRCKTDLSMQAKDETKGAVYYRAPCGRPLYKMTDVFNYLDDTRSELTIDVFSFAYEVDETAYVDIPPDDKSVKLKDLSNGAEARPIPVVNNVDEEALPTFMYRSRRYPLSDKIEMQTTSNDFCSGCDCTDDCRDWTKCACQRLTHSESVRTKHTFKNITKGYTNRLLKEKVTTGIYECNENCLCSRKRCINRVVQNDIKIPMQMMKTAGMGWGVRAMVDIPHGTFIACYHGAMLSDTIAEGVQARTEGDEYFADLDLYNIVHIEKVNAGVDCMEDQGCFFEDVGARELTSAEILKGEREDELGKMRMEEEDQKEIARKAKRREAKKVQRERTMKTREITRKEEAREEGEEDTEEDEGEVAVEVEEEEEESPEREANENGNGIEDGEDGEEGSDERDERDVANASLDEGVLADLDDTLDNAIDEGVEEGDSQDEGSMDEEEVEEVAMKPSKDEVDEEKEAEARKKERDARIEASRKEEIKRQKRVRAESKLRYTIPFKDEDGREQIEAYFIDGGSDHLFLIDAKRGGNIGRQFNHGCEPNMYTQHIFVDTHDIRLPWAAFFASRDIVAGEELCWDYGWNVDESNPRGLKCECGADTCRVDLL